MNNGAMFPGKHPGAQRVRLRRDVAAIAERINHLGPGLYAIVLEVDGNKDLTWSCVDVNERRENAKA